MLMEQSLQTTQDQLSQRVTEVVRHEQQNRKLQVKNIFYMDIKYDYTFSNIG